MTLPHQPHDAPAAAAAPAIELTLAVPADLYAALRDVAHDEGHTIQEQAIGAIREMLTERKRRPLFD